MKDLLLHRILIVDDEPEYCNMVRQFLDKLGYSCEIATSALEALHKLREKRFDLVISDIHMSGMNGLALAREAKQEFPDLDFRRSDLQFGFSIRKLDPRRPRRSHEGQNGYRYRSSPFHHQKNEQNCRHKKRLGL